MLCRCGCVLLIVWLLIGVVCVVVFCCWFVLVAWWVCGWCVVVCFVVVVCYVCGCVCCFMVVVVSWLVCCCCVLFCGCLVCVLVHKQPSHKWVLRFLGKVYATYVRSECGDLQISAFASITFELPDSTTCKIL